MRPLPAPLRCVAALALLLLAFAPSPALRAEPIPYDPLAARPAGTELDLTVTDAARRRDIPVRVYLPAATKPAPLILFSHGLGGSRAGSAFLGRHWSMRGFVAVFLQHPGSDESVWRDAPLLERRQRLTEAASLGNFVARSKDVSAVLDQLTRWNTSAGHPLGGRLDPAKAGLAGHSFGAGTTQAVGGQRFPLGISFRDPRILAAVPMSPSPPRRGDAATAFGSIPIPWLVMTGTHDGSPIGQMSPADRLRVFPALSPGRKYSLVLEGAEHSVFTERALPGESKPRNPNHHRAILALTTAFFEAYLRDDAAARAWLDGKGPRGVLAAGDRWERK